MPTEITGYQYGFDTDFEAETLVPITQHTPGGQRPILLSPSRLENIAKVLDHPDHPIPEPRQTPLATHFKIMLGIMLHEIERDTHIWRSLLSTGSNFRHEYYSRLEQLALLIPTTPTHEVRRIHSLLANPRLVIPRDFSLTGRTARRTVYTLITSAVTDFFRSGPPFTATPAFGELTDELPFPNPQAFTTLWEQHQGNQCLADTVDHIFADHEDHPPLPLSPLVSGHFTAHASEVRLRTMSLPGTVWNTRLDSVHRGQQTHPPHKIVTVVDYKLQLPNFPPPESFSRQALRAILFLTSALAINLPPLIPADGKSQEVPIYKWCDPDASVTIQYLESARTGSIDFTPYWGHDWTTRGQSLQARRSLSSLLTTIQENADRLAPLLT